MLGICFKREPRNWMQDQWSYTFSNFGITDIWEREYADGDLVIYQKTIPIHSAEELPDKTLIAVSPEAARFVKGNENLIDFEHPEDAIYLFGGSHSVLTLEELGNRVPDHIVYIPSVKNELYAFSAANIVLYDRRVKRGSFG
jgi:hypothetical protein